MHTYNLWWDACLLANNMQKLIIHHTEYLSSIDIKDKRCWRTHPWCFLPGYRRYWAARTISAQPLYITQERNAKLLFLLLPNFPWLQVLPFECWYILISCHGMSDTDLLLYLLSTPGNITPLMCTAVSSGPCLCLVWWWWGQVEREDPQHGCRQSGKQACV